MHASSDTLNIAGKTIAFVLVVCVIGFLLIASGPTSGGAAVQERILESSIRPEVPIKIKIKKEKEESFKDLKNAKWVREFELEVTNTSDKPIYFLYINLVTDVKFGGKALIFNLHYGRPELGDLVSKALPDDSPIKPKETYTFKLHSGQIPAWERGVLEGTHADAMKVRISLQGISFGDGTGYLGNTPYPPEPKGQADLGIKERRNRIKKTLPRSTSPPSLQAQRSLSIQKPAKFSPVNFLSAEPSNLLSALPSTPEGSCLFSECVTVIIKPAEYVCYNCPYQNRPSVSSAGVCKELNYDFIRCTSGTVDYLCQTIDIE